MAEERRNRTFCDAQSHGTRQEVHETPQSLDFRRRDFFKHPFGGTLIVEASGEYAIGQYTIKQIQILEDL